MRRSGIYVSPRASCCRFGGVSLRLPRQKTSDHPAGEHHPPQWVTNPRFCHAGIVLRITGTARGKATCVTVKMDCVRAREELMMPGHGSRSP